MPLIAVDIATQKYTFDDNKCKINECQTVKTDLRNQIIDAVAPDYVQYLRNATTDMINNTIPEIFTFLRDTYELLSSGQLK